MSLFILFRWTFNLFKTGKKRDLEVNDLYTTLDTHASAILGNKLEKLIIQYGFYYFHYIFIYLFFIKKMENGVDQSKKGKETA